MLAKGGRVVWLHDVASVLARDDTGQSYRYQGVQLDITDRKEAEDAQRRGAEELRRFEQQRRELLESLVTTQETERRRIADGIHDETIQSLFALQMRLSSIATRYPELEQLEDFPQLRQELLDAMAGLSNLTFELHPDILETEGLVPALRLHVERWRTPDAPELNVVDRLERRPSKETRSMMYRIAQEALTNVRKHSHASRITVSLEHRDRGFRVVIEDDGDGFDAERATRSDPGPPRPHVDARASGDGRGVVNGPERSRRGDYRRDLAPGRRLRLTTWGSHDRRQPVKRLHLHHAPAAQPVDGEEGRLSS